MADAQKNTTTPDLGWDEYALLMREVSDGNEKALRTIIERWKNPLMAFFYRSVRDAHLAEDLTQTTFVNLYKARKTYAGYMQSASSGAKFSTYLFFLARRILISEHRKAQVRPADATDPSDAVFASKTVSETGKTAELEEIFYDTVRRMPENWRTAILLLKQQELSYAEIADIMNADISAVKTWIFRARQTLKDALKNMG